MNLSLKNEYTRYRRYFTNIAKGEQAIKARSLAWVSLSVFTVSFFIITAIRPTLITIARLNNEIKVREEANHQLQAKIDAVIAAQAEFAKYADRLPLLNEALPEKNDFPLLVYFLEEIASQSAVNLNGISLERIITYSKSDSKPGLASFKFSISATGPYANLQELLANLEASRRVIKIGKTSLGETKVRNEKVLSISVNGEVNYEKR